MKIKSFMIISPDSSRGIATCQILEQIRNNTPPRRKFKAIGYLAKIGQTAAHQHNTLCKV